MLSDAVDRSVASINFRPLAGRTVYLDTQYVKSVKGAGFVSADYIISSLRQQMLAANCLLEEDREKAEYIAEVRVGALGTDAHNMTYGIPASNSLSTAASLVPNAPAIPAIPEISLAKKEDEVAAAKIAVFAYHRESRQAVWQSGIAQARSSAKDTWFFGAGPFQSGSLHDSTKLAGEALVPDIEIPLITAAKEEDDDSLDLLKRYGEDYTFNPRMDEQVEVTPASHSEEASAEPVEVAEKPGTEQK